MSYKQYCDACQNEITTNRFPFKFEYPGHLSNILINKPIHEYVDNDGNAISGRTDSVDLCVACTNRVLGAAITKLKEIQCSNISLDKKRG